MTIALAKITHCDAPRDGRLYYLKARPGDKAKAILLRVLDACPKCKMSEWQVAAVNSWGAISEFKGVKTTQRPQWEQRLAADLLHEITTRQQLRGALQEKFKMVGDYTELISGDTADVYQRVLQQIA